MSRQIEQMWESLFKAGIVNGAVPEAREHESPWYVKVLLAFSAWLASLFLLGFIGVGLAFIIESSTKSFIIGGVMIGISFAGLRTAKNEFVEHLSLSVSLAGQALIVWAIFDFTDFNGSIFWLLVTLLQVTLAVVMPNFVHRVFSSAIAAFAFSTAMGTISVSFIVSSIIMFLAAWLWLNEFRYPHYIKEIRAIGYGLILALIPLKGSALFGQGNMSLRFLHNQPELWVQPWISEVLAGAVTLYVVWQIIERLGQGISRQFAITVLLCTLILCGVSIEAQGITIGMTIIFLGFAGGNRSLLGLGVVSLFFYISSYYYLLDETLLVKAQTLVMVGLVLLFARWLLLRMTPNEKEAEHEHV